jgi:hypothetical protein
MYNDIRNMLCAADPFLQMALMVQLRKKISTDAKLMIAIKVLAYGSYANSLHDYYQLEDSTVCLDLKNFTAGIAYNQNLRETLLCSIAPSDAKQVEAMHHEQHGVRRIASCLDCIHVQWMNCL